MRRTRVAFASALFLLALAAPAAAHTRDPFDPVIDLTPDVATGTGTQAGGTGTGTGGTGGTGGAFQAGSAGGLADTGSTTTTWLAVGYASLALGGAALVLARTLRINPGLTAGSARRLSAPRTPRG
ncbi:MAG: hypothetical protein ABR575_05315 [Actinomycetota bacterium]